MFATFSHDMGTISHVALSFMVQDPKLIIELASEMSLL